MMGHRQELKSADEVTAISGKHNGHKTIWDAGIRKRIKRKLSKRARRIVKHELNRDRDLVTC